MPKETFHSMDHEVQDITILTCILVSSTFCHSYDTACTCSSFSAGCVNIARLPCAKDVLDTADAASTHL